MAVEATPIAGLLAVRWPVHEDARGFLRQSYQTAELATALGRVPALRQGNHSRSHPGVLRGFHFEPWDKLVYVVRGTAFYAVADIRPESPTFGRHVTFMLGDPPGERLRLFISRGLANAFYCLTETDYINDVSEEFNAHKRGGVIWNDPTLAVDWPTDAPVLSTADRAWPTLQSLSPNIQSFDKAAGERQTETPRI